MSSTDDVIKRILAIKPTLTRDVIEILIQEEKVKAAGLLTDEAAAHLVASNLGINGAGERIEAKLKIGGLTSGLNDVSLSARVIQVFESRNFTRADGRQGKVLRMLIGDSTGMVAAIFWDDKADHVVASKIQRGKIIRILHAYSRERQNGGEIEVNVGGRGQVYMEPLDAVDVDFPAVDSFFKLPGEVQTAGSVNVTGVVVDRSPVNTFVKKDGSGEGKVTRLSIQEEGRRIPLVVWEDKVDELAGLQIGTRIRVIGASSRVRTGGGFEIHLSRGSIVEVLEEGVLPREAEAKWAKIGELTPDMRNVSAAGKVTQLNEPREFTKKDGSKGQVASVVLQDDTGIVRLSLWDDDVNLLKEIKPGTVLAIENGYTRAGYGGGIDLNAGRMGRIRIDPDDIQVDMLDGEDRLTEIRDLVEGQKNINVKGKLLDEPVSREVNTLRGPVSVVSFRMDDGTGETRVSLWRDHGKAVEGLSAEAEVLIENCNVREPFDGLMQISSTGYTKIKILKK